MAEKPPEEKAKATAIQSLKTWGENSFPPTLLASLITSIHARPFQALPMLFPPLLLGSSYANLQGYKIDSAGFTAAWSALYFVLAQRRKQKFTSKFKLRGAIRGATLGLCAVNVVGCGVAYAFGSREQEAKNRRVW
ncbi:hypothetical protein K402DRAFT_445593 [Aulographum hederae CBS 113979]|uniref:Uncharacterized protein n=1 Tax=Aulographum hederae CBS 113979 TaxID=1176131 RepID=A0A6G1H3Y5_9PEZI|nr:hypothetical protein K402DRAFT_445593 [Aulographum hederae CBS 113979]